MSDRLTLYNARLLCAATGRDEIGGIVIEAGRILDLGSHIKPHKAAVDCQRQALIPGLIDSRVQLSDPGRRDRETLEETLSAAVRGGITTLVAVPAPFAQIDSVSGLDSLREQAKGLALARLEVTAAVTQGAAGAELNALGLLADAGAVALSDGHRPLASSRFFAEALRQSDLHGLALCNLCLDPELGRGHMHAGLMATRLGLEGSPSVAEVLMLERDLQLLRSYGGRYHASLITSAEGVACIRRAKAEGLAVTAATSVHHLLLNELAVEGYRTFAKLWPPLRSESDRLALVQGLADGTIDCLVSDHCPVDSEAKRVPFASAESGMVGLEALLPLSLLAVQRGDLSLMRWLDAMTLAPAKLHRLERGALKIGAAADLTLVDLDAPRLLDADALSTPCRNFSYETLPAQGKVLKTWVAGRCRFDAEV